MIDEKPRPAAVPAPERTPATDPLAFAALAERHRWQLVQLHGLTATENGKNPKGLDWGAKGKFASVGRVKTWRERGGNVGLLPSPSGLAVLDVEPGGLATWPRERMPAGALRVGTPSGGFHLYLDRAAVGRALGGASLDSLEIAKLEVRGAELIFGGPSKAAQVVVPPSVARSRKAPGGPRVGPYVVEVLGEPIEDEGILRELLAPFALVAAEARRKAQAGAPSGAPRARSVRQASLATCVARILNAQTRRDEELVAAVNEAIGGPVARFEVSLDEAEAAMADAAEERAGMPDCREDPPSFARDPRATVARLFANSTVAARIREQSKREISPEPPAPGDEKGASVDAPERAAKSPAPSIAPVRWFAPSELPQSSPDDDLVRDFIGLGEVGCLAGASAAGKSFLAIALAVACAGDAETFLGLRVQKHGVVLYFAGEGFGGLRARVMAADPEGRASARLRFAPEVPTLLEPSSVKRTLDAARGLIEQLGGEAPVLIVIDTFATAVAGADENDNGQMGAAAKAAGVFARELNVAVLLVHHAKKARQAGESFLRGASSLLCALDGAWGIERLQGNDMARVVTCEKSKDRASDGAWRVELEAVSVGDRTTLRVAKATSIAAPERERMEAKKGAALRLLRRDTVLSMLAPFPGGLAPAEIREGLVRRGFAMPERSLRDVLDKLRAAELVDSTGEAQARRVRLTDRGTAVARRLEADAGLGSDPHAGGPPMDPDPSGGPEKPGPARVRQGFGEEGRS